MTQHGYPYQGPGQPGGRQHGGQPPYGQAPADVGQPQYGQPQQGYPPPGQQQHAQPQPAHSFAPPHQEQQYAHPQPVPQFAQPGQYDQLSPESQYGQPAPGQQYGQAPAFGYGVPAGAHPPAGGYVGQQGPTAPNGQELADVWMRLLARVIDGLIVGGLVSIIVVPLVLIVFVVSVNTGDQGGTLLGVLLITELAAFVLTLAGQYVYDVEFAKRSGQTVGKRVFKLRIVPLDPHQPLDRGVLARRWLVSSPGGLVPGLGMFNVLWCLWDQPYRQCLHDKFAKTVVVKVPA